MINTQLCNGEELRTLRIISEGGGGRGVKKGRFWRYLIYERSLSGMPYVRSLYMILIFISRFDTYFFFLCSYLYFYIQNSEAG